MVRNKTTTLRISAQGQQEVKRAIATKKWKISAEDSRPLIKASLEYIEEYKQVNQLTDWDSHWLTYFEQIFRVEKFNDSQKNKEQKKQETDKKIAKIIAELTNFPKDNLLKQIKTYIELEEISVKGISYRTLYNFSAKKPIDANIFKIYCRILDLDWQEVVEINIIEDPPKKSKIIHNLPHPKYSKFIGRKEEITLLKNQLDLNTPCISIVGIGGVGKTSLVLELAYNFLKIDAQTSNKLNQYDVIIFTSFKQQEITNDGIIQPLIKCQLSCRHIFNTIAITLNKKELIKLEIDELFTEIIDLLKGYKVLLIIDNLETVDDTNSILWFLHQIPLNIQAIITSRHKISFGVSLNINDLSINSSLELIKTQAQQKNIILTEEQICLIHLKTCGIPLAIILVIGQLANHYSFEYVIDNLSNGCNEIITYCFENSITPLKDKFSYKLLTTLALFSKIPNNKTIIKIANIQNKNQIEAGFFQLQKLSLIQCNCGKYEILSIIRNYVLTELAKDSLWENQLRERWVNYYQIFVKKYGGQDEKEWHNYDQLQEEWENLTEVIFWCINQNRYNDVKYFWHFIKGYSHIQGYQSDRLNNWHSRLEWTDWLIKTGELNQDYGTVAEVIFDRAWTFTLMGNKKSLDQAITLFAKAWFLRNYHPNIIFSIDLSIHIAYFRLVQKKINLAQQWINKSLKLLKNLQGTENNYPRQFILLNFYQGRIEFTKKNYLEASNNFQKSLKLAKKIQWQRAVFLCEKWLGDIAIELKNFSEAQTRLKTYLTLATKNNDQVGLAYYKQSLAFLAQGKGNYDLAQKLTAQALEDFEKLGIIHPNI
jgi:tetratricopeptide (TPR) repeat protein